MDTCKHNWHFVHGTSTLKCQRCSKMAASRPEDLYTVPTGQVYTFGNFKPDYNISFHRVVEGRNGDLVGKLDFNGPELVFTGDAAESAKVFVDWVARSFHGRLETEREAGRKEAQEITWGVDWGRAGNKSCATIIKRLPGGKIEVVAVEYEP